MSRILLELLCTNGDQVVYVESLAVYSRAEAHGELVSECCRSLLGIWAVTLVLTSLAVKYARGILHHHTMLLLISLCRRCCYYMLLSRGYSDGKVIIDLDISDCVVVI